VIETLPHEFLPMTPTVKPGDREDPHASPPSFCTHCRLEAWSRRSGEECPVRLRIALDEAQEQVQGARLAVSRLRAWSDRTSSLPGEEAHDVRNALFMVESWLQARTVRSTP